MFNIYQQRVLDKKREQAANQKRREAALEVSKEHLSQVLYGGGQDELARRHQERVEDWVTHTMATGIPGPEITLAPDKHTCV